MSRHTLGSLLVIAALLAGFAAPAHADSIITFSDGDFNLAGGVFDAFGFHSTDAQVTRIYGDGIIGDHFDVWGDITGLDARMELRIFSFPSPQFNGCAACTIDIDAGQLTRFQWSSADFFALSNNIPPFGEMLPVFGDGFPEIFGIPGLPPCVGPNCPLVVRQFLFNPTFALVTPEPNTLALLGTGLAALIVWKRRA